MCSWKSGNPAVKNKLFNNAEALKAYADYERQITVNHLKVGCYLVMTLMPVGVVLDFFVYPKELGYFFILRLACALLAGAVLAILRMPFSLKIHWLLSLLIALLPSFFICWMIYLTEGFGSPYYAGLNLVLLSVAVVAMADSFMKAVPDANAASKVRALPLQLRRK